MIRRPFIQSITQVLTETQRISHPPSDTTFRIDTLEVAHQHQPEVRARRQRRPSIVIRIEPRALTLAELVKLLAVQQPVRLFIKWMTRTTDQLAMRDPKLLLPLPLFAGAHPHTNI